MSRATSSGRLVSPRHHRTQADGEEFLAYEQHLFNTIMDSSPYAIWFKDAAGRFIRVNRAWADRRGLDDPAIAIGKTDWDFSPEKVAREILADEQAILETGQPLVDKEARGEFPDGQAIWVLTTKMPLRDKGRDYRRHVWYLARYHRVQAGADGAGASLCGGRKAGRRAHRQLSKKSLHANRLKPRFAC